jgi:hypothetical protein
MNANELADELDGFLKEQEQLPWGTKQVYLDQAVTMLRQQADRIGVLEANHKIQLNIVEMQLDYINQLEQGLRASIDLNKALVERKNECPPASWWKGDPTCGGLTENYGLRKAQEK